LVPSLTTDLKVGGDEVAGTMQVRDVALGSVEGVLGGFFAVGFFFGIFFRGIFFGQSPSGSNHLLALGILCFSLHPQSPSGSWRVL
jgi:hypothetical protein